MPHLTLTLLGAFQAQVDNQPLTAFHSAKVQGLLAYLAVEALRPHARESLMALFWPDDAPQSAQQSLRQALYALRRTLGDTDNPAREPFLLVTRQTVQLNPAAAVALDVAAFLQQVQQGKLAQAAALYSAELLTGLTTDSAPFEEWLRTTRQYLHNLTLNALNQLTQQRLDHGDNWQAALYARRQLALEPWREEAHRQVMTALAWSGDRSAALAQYDTCRRVLAEELGVEPATATTTLYTQIRDGQLAGKVNTSSPLPVIQSSSHLVTPPLRHNLPLQPTPFIGRQTDLEQITARLQDPTCRLLTIIGPGGMGKTRLAIQAAQTTLDWDFDDGVFFVALADISSPDLLVPTIAAALDFTFYGNGAPKTQLLNYLHDKALLLVLDNCEHLLNGIELVADLLAAAPRLKVLATSRELLNLREEWLQPLAGLSFPADGKDPALLASYTAVQLFAQRARMMKPDFELITEPAAVVHICRLVDGMPLGIELVTTWLKFYSCQQIATQMVDKLDFFTSKLRNLPARHRSMRAVFEHSWQLLTAAEQRHFARLALFRGGFQAVAAAQVTGATLPLLHALVDKSLLQIAPNGRFQLHELLRQFADEKLRADMREYTDAAAQHGVYYTAFLADQTDRLKGAAHLTAMNDIEQEIENIRMVWGWAVAQQRLTEIEQAAESLFLFHAAKCWFEQGRTLFAQATAALHPAIDEHSRIVLVQLRIKQTRLHNRQVVEGGMAALLSDNATIYEQCLAWLQPYDLPNVMAEALVGLGSVRTQMGDQQTAYQLNEQAFALYRSAGNQWGVARTFHNRGLIANHRGQSAAAKQLCAQGVALAEATGDPRLLGDLLQVYSEAHRALGEYAEARKRAEAALAACTAIRNQRGIAFSLHLLGDLAWRLGQYEDAWQNADRSYALFVELGLQRASDFARVTLGNIACSLGRLAEAHDHFLAVLQLRLAAADLHWHRVPDALTGLADVLDKAGEAEQAVVLLDHASRHPTVWQETKARAVHLLTTLTTQLPVETVAAAQTKAQQVTLRDLIDRLLSAGQAIGT